MLWIRISWVCLSVVGQDILGRPECCGSGYLGYVWVLWVRISWVCLGVVGQDILGRYAVSVSRDIVI